MLAAAGQHPAFLSRGYGGRQTGPLLVDHDRHDAGDVGDEALLLARVAPTVVARMRVAGARLAITAGASVILMDDGFQNPIPLAKDFSLLVVDGRRGIGNGKVIPAGPLRAPLDAQLARAHALVIVGPQSGAAEILARARHRDIPSFAARFEPDAAVVEALGGGRVLAFAGIGDPDKFFATLVDAGIAVAATRRFPDHHRYTPEEARALRAAADRENLILVTTEKDRARMTGSRELADLAAHAQALPARLVFDDVDRLELLLLTQIAAAQSSKPPRSAKI